MDRYGSAHVQDASWSWYVPCPLNAARFQAHAGLQTGVLSLPSVLQTLGIVPGTITLITVGALSTCESLQLFAVVTCTDERG